MISFRKASIDDLDLVLDIYNDAINKFEIEKTFQWTKGFPPNEDSFRSDLINNDIFVCLDNEKVIGVMTCILTGEDDYLEIDGEWLNDEPYLTIHRIAVSKEYYGKGIGYSLISYAKEFALKNKLNNIRIDTHELNLDMRKMLERNGFIRCGIIKLRNKNNDLRDAYQLAIE